MKSDNFYKRLTRVPHNIGINFEVRRITVHFYFFEITFVMIVCIPYE